MNKIFRKLNILIIGLVLSSLFLTAFVWADDDEHDDDHDSSSSSSSSEPKVETETTTSTRVIVERDSDGDGLMDNNDPHPDIPEIYIVEDNNSNGIVDSLENIEKVQEDEK